MKILSLQFKVLLLVAVAMSLAMGVSLLAVTRVVHDHKGRRVQLLRGLYRPDRYQYRMQLSRGGDDVPRVWVSNDTIHRSNARHVGRGNRMSTPEAIHE